MLRPLLLVVAVAPLAAAKPAPPTPATPADAASEILSQLEIDVALKLLEPGAEPRAVVRYKPTPGATSTYETVARTSMDMSMVGPDGNTMSLPMGDMMPTMVMKARNTVGQPTPNGLVPVRIEQLGMRLEGDTPPEMAEAMQGSRAALDGMIFDMLVDANGKPVQLDIVSGGGDPAMGDLVQQLADQMIDRMATFPSEPIGVGARWTSVVDMSMSGLVMSVTQTSVVRAVTPQAIDLDVTMKMDLGNGAMQFPGMPPGVAPEITKFVGTGGGATHIDLGTLVATGSMTMDLDMAMKITAPGQPPMSMSMKMKQATEMRAAR